MENSRMESPERRGGMLGRNRALWLVGTIAVAIIAVVLVLNMADSGTLPGESFPSLGNQHIADVSSPHPEYNSDPPTSGWHVGSLARWGSYDYELPVELLIHNMEDGGVILWYPLGTQEENREQIARLAQAARGYERVVIAPRDSLSGEYALTAWTRLDRFPIEEFSEERIRAFLEAYEGIDHH